MPKWDLASETMIKTIKGEVVCCPCKLQAAVVSAMVSNTCPALTTEYTEYWTDRLLDQWMDFGKEFFSSKCPIEGKKVKESCHALVVDVVVCMMDNMDITDLWPIFISNL